MAEAELRRQEVEMQVALARYADLERRLTLLTAASGRLISVLDRHELAGAIVDLGMELVQTDAVSVWLLQPDGMWSVAAQRGLSEGFLAASIGRPGPVQFHEPMVYADVFAAPELEVRHPLYRTEGIRSMLVAPLIVGAAAPGS